MKIPTKIKTRIYFKKLKLFLFITITIFVAHAVYLNCIAEDAFISFRFAENLTSGHGLVWNAGEAPVEGYTNFLWVMISALVLKLGLDLPLFSQLIGVLAGIFTIIYTYKFSRKLLNLPEVYSLVPCLFIAVSGPFAAWASSGMETSLFGMFILAGVYYITNYLITNNKKYLFVGFIILLLGAFTRPEGLMFFFILLFYCFMQNIKQPAVFFKDILLPSLIFQIPFLIYFLLRWNYFGFILPNTFYAKTGFSPYIILRGLSYTLFFTLYYVLPLLVPVIWSFWKNSNNSMIIKKPGLQICLITLFIYSAYIIFIGGDYMAMFRFFVPVLPFLYLVTGESINELYTKNTSRSFMVTVIVMVISAVTVFWSTPLETALPKLTNIYHGNYRGVHIERWNSARLSQIGKFFKEYGNDTQKSIATDAIGAIAYYSGMKILDKYGIVDIHIAHMKIKNMGKGFPGHEKEDMKYIISKNPTYIMLNRNFKPLPWNKDPQLKNLNWGKYQLVSVWLKDTANKEEGYFTFLELKK